jgi:hypothetical protein
MVEFTGKQCPVQDVEEGQTEFIDCPFAGEAMCPQSRTCVLLLAVLFEGDEDEDDDDE